KSPLNLYRFVFRAKSKTKFDLSIFQHQLKKPTLKKIHQKTSHQLKFSPKRFAARIKSIVAILAHFRFEYDQNNKCSGLLLSKVVFCPGKPIRFNGCNMKI
ncbi:hypothetical protein BpHYR1_022360, partial [Brachionus plicatilis]